ncbi:quinoprotein [Rhodovulum iodosum]|nr:quinoprotein [Rhodovulum robiginosum]
MAALAVLSACGQRETILPGERLGVREALPGVVAEDATAPLDAAARDTAIALPPVEARADWPQVGGGPEHRARHSALGAGLSDVWRASIGAGDSRRYRITADPVVAGGRVFTLDARSRASAVSTAGQVLWSQDLTPVSERNSDATGGGLAYGDGRLFATTGFGALVALDPQTGAELWRQRTDAAVTGAPAYRDGLVYVVSRDNRAWAIKAENGRVQWQLPGTPSPSGMVGGAAPAVGDRLAVFPFASSELVATLRQSGVRVWSAAVSGQRRGRVYATVTDITADPVIDGDTIYTGNQSGRAVALKASSGERIWTAEHGAYGAVLPVAGAVFLISDQGKLVRLDAGSGETVWDVDLPYYTRERVRRRKAIFAHYGPVLAGGRLIVASDDGLIRSFSPNSGALLSTVEIPGGASTRPVVAGGTLYVVSAKGQLHAFR